MGKFTALLAIAGLALLTAATATANSPAIHSTEDVTGDVFVCEDETYTVTSGEIAFTFHEGSSASGNGNFTATIVPKNVIFEDSDGDAYRAVGAVWFGGTFNAQKGSFQGTFTFKLQIVSVGGGKPDSVNLVAHESSNGANFFFDRGTCEELV